MRGRGRYSSDAAPTGDDFSELTNYDEKSVRPTDGALGDRPTEYASAYGAPTGGYREQSYGSQSGSGAGSPDGRAEAGEIPLVFASRQDSKVFIYEYSDRLELYFRDENNKMRKFNIQYKQR